MPFVIFVRTSFVFSCLYVFINLRIIQYNEGPPSIFLQIRGRNFFLICGLGPNLFFQYSSAWTPVQAKGQHSSHTYNNVSDYQDFWWDPHIAFAIHASHTSASNMWVLLVMALRRVWSNEPVLSIHEPLWESYSYSSFCCVSGNWYTSNRRECPKT